MLSRKSLVAFVAAMVFLVGSAYAAELKSSRVVPPSHLLSGVEAIGFADFKGPGGNALKKEMVELANESERQGKKIIRLRKPASSATRPIW